MSERSDSQPHVLLVDDNPAFVENLAEILEGQGYAVESAGTCASALERTKHGIDVALVDVRLPDGEGTALAKKIKELNPESEVILLTGYATLESAAEAVRAGACAYLLKPCATPELLLTLEQAMRQVRLQRDKRELARRAQVAEKLAAVGTLTAGLSHEIRNPLNAAGLQLAVVERRVDQLPKEMRVPILEPLHLVRDEIRRLDHILEDFMQFARPTQFVPQPVDLETVARKVYSLLKDDADQRGIRFECTGSDRTRVLGHEERLRQVIVNLALNALDAASAGGWVRLICDQIEGDVAFLIEDSGPGVQPEAMGRIFEPFFTTKSTGSGLGLSIVHAIVTQHSGTIHAENIPGAGARFTVRLPSAHP